MVRVGVLGAAGRMGQTVCQAVASDPDLELVAAVDPRLAPDGDDGDGGDGGDGGAAGADGASASLPVDTTGVRLGGRLDTLLDAGAEVAVDFTEAAVAAGNMAWCAAHDVHAVVGTSGIGSEQLEELRAAFGASKANCVLAPNFAIGAVLMMRLCALAAPYMDSVEIVELHHDAKIDAPSGTALRTAELVEDARQRAGSGSWRPDPTTKTVLAGARGALAPGGVHVHSLRLHGLVAHQEVVFGAEGQSLTVRHDAYDRTAFMPGVVLAIKEVGRRPWLTVGLETLLGF
jgi:4-hydroxy-tetrahydrodipicolinate reductase